MMAIRTLVIDDSISMQRMISTVLGSDPEIEVVGTANDAFHARDQIKALNPDVITLDIEMPRMDGLEFLARLMKLRPMPVVMISSHTTQGADAALSALRMGAFSCLPKPNMGDESALTEMCEMVKAAATAASVIKQKAGSQVAVTTNSAPAAVGQLLKNIIPRSVNSPELIAIGSSTGGVEALETVLQRFPKDCPPTVITQHMPANFTTSFAHRLDTMCAPTVLEAEDNLALERGHIYLAPGAVGHLAVKRLGEFRCYIRDGEPCNGHKPSVDILFNSIAKFGNSRISSALLTGMGTDGAKGMLALKNSGVKTVAQNKATCVVYGMPSAAVKLDAVDDVLPLGDIAEAVLIVKRRK
ncbi:MAG: chemotaxis response regulator protein-glutamate methylesterase [Rhizobiaceae bacterium]